MRKNEKDSRIFRKKEGKKGGETKDGEKREREGKEGGSVDGSMREEGR